MVITEGFKSSKYSMKWKEWELNLAFLLSPSILHACAYNGSWTMEQHAQLYKRKQIAFEFMYVIRFDMYLNMDAL